MCAVQTCFAFCLSLLLFQFMPATKCCKHTTLEHFVAKNFDFGLGNL